MAKILAGVSTVWEFITEDQQKVRTHYSSHMGRYAWTVFLSERCVYNEWADRPHQQDITYWNALEITEKAIENK